MQPVRGSENSTRQARFLGPLRQLGGKWKEWSWTDRWLVLQALVLLPVVSCGLRLAGYQRFRHWVTWTLPRRDHSEEQGREAEIEVELAKRIGQLVNGAARWGVCRANCLTRSTTVWWLASRRGIAAEIVLGTRVANSTFQAHAWVECHQVVVNDRLDVADRFRPF